MHILLIARHYPPEISGGARRPSLYVAGLRELGHRVTVVTPFRLDDPDMLTVENAAINNGVKALHDKNSAHRHEGILPRLKTAIRLWAYWPDPNIVWVRDVIKTVKRKDLRPDWIMTTSPPESIHIAGAKLSKHLNVPWLAELRDTWVEHPHRAILATSKIRAFFEKRIAKKTLHGAKALTSVSEAIMSEGRKYVKPGTPELIISHFSDPPPAPFAFDNAKLNLVHTGGFTLSDRRRVLPPLLDMLDQLSQKRQNLVFHIAGPLSAQEVSLIESSDVTVEWHGSVALQEARALQAGADGLILYSPANSHALPGKYAEYAHTGRPILYFGGGDWLNLADNKTNLLPLETGGVSLQKNTSTASRTSPNHIGASKALAGFLDKLKPSG